MATAKYSIGDRLQGRSNTNRLVDGVVASVMLYSVGYYYDVRTDDGGLVKIDEPTATCVVEQDAA